MGMRRYRKLWFVLPVVLVYAYVVYAFYGPSWSSGGSLNSGGGNNNNNNNNNVNNKNVIARDKLPDDDSLYDDGDSAEAFANVGVDSNVGERDPVANNAIRDANNNNEHEDDDEDEESADENKEGPNVFDAVECMGPYDGYPQCEEKLAWLRNNWRTHMCYEELGVDGTDCSFQEYLNVYEDMCPPPNQAGADKSGNGARKGATRRLATFQKSLAGLFLRLEPNHKHAWILTRLRRMEPEWKAAIEVYAASQSGKERERKNILMYMGFVSDAFNERIAENAFSGGPLGELVQWADLMATLYLLGHELTIVTEQHELSRHTGTSTPCGVGGGVGFDIVYIDIIGLRHFRGASSDAFDKHRCKFRVLDSFGTEAQFNVGFNNEWSDWGGWRLNLKQFYTMFPHSPDNSFLGFVVEKPRRIVPWDQKKNRAVIYGKELDMWIGKRSLIDAVHVRFEVHATVGNTKADRVDKSVVPPYVVNHGVLSADDLQDLLAESKVFVGMGFPYEGPAPLEAIANGCIFINARFTPPKSALNTPFFAGKPTRREFSSQHPYMEDFVGTPHVITVDVDNPDSIIVALDNAVSRAPTAKIPREFTMGGIIERVDAFVRHHLFCDDAGVVWPPLRSLVSIVSEPGLSCKETCRLRAYVCEPAFFPLINKREEASSLLNCKSTAETKALTAPHKHSMAAACSLQEDPMLFSCVGKAPNVVRLCPCRDFLPGQSAICTRCL